MKITNKYLGCEQINQIADLMTQQKSYIGRKITKYIMVASYCTDLEIATNKKGKLS